VKKNFENRGLSKRRLVVFSSFIFFLNACESENMRVILDVVVFSYLDRPIFEIEVDGKGDESSGVYPQTGKSTSAGIELQLGSKEVTWRLDGPQGAARNGETVSNKNNLKLDYVMPGAKFLAIHIYPDDTVELITSVHFPQLSIRGETEVRKMGKQHG
jgi:hypothetical protein